MDWADNQVPRFSNSTRRLESLAPCPFCSAVNRASRKELYQFTECLLKMMKWVWKHGGQSTKAAFSIAFSLHHPTSK